MDTMESGTKMYMSLYPEGSSDGSTFKKKTYSDVCTAILWLGLGAMQSFAFILVRANL